MGMITLKFRKSTGDTPWRFVFSSESEAELHKARGCPGCAFSADKLTYPLERVVIEWFLQHMPDTQFGPEVTTYLEALASTKRAVARLGAEKYKRVLVQVPYADKLYDYQTRGAQWLATTKRGILADEPGLGKTIQSLTACDLIGAKRVLVVTVNLTVQNQWAATVDTWNLGTVTVVTGTAVQRTKLLSTPSRFHVIPSSLLSMKGPVLSSLLSQNYDAIILDEAHQYQNADAARSKVAGKLKSEYLFMLTGTPVWNKLDSLWGLLHLINKPRWSSYWLWINRYFEVWDSPFGTQIGKPRASMFATLKKEIDEVLIRRELLEVCTDFPVATTRVHEVEMDGDVKAEYKRLRTLVSDYQDVNMGGTWIPVNNPIQVIPILRAFLNNYALRAPPCGTLAGTHENPKLDGLRDLVFQARTAGLQTLVFTWHTAYADYLADALVGARATHGKKTAEYRAHTIGAFREKEFDVLIASIASLGVGVDLPNVDVVAFMEADYVPAMIEQAWRRIYRITSTSTKLIAFFYHKGTIEEAVYKSFMNKQALSDDLLADQILKAD